LPQAPPRLALLPPEVRASIVQRLQEMRMIAASPLLTCRCRPQLFLARMHALRCPAGPCPLLQRCSRTLFLKKTALWSPIAARNLRIFFSFIFFLVVTPFRLTSTPFSCVRGDRMKTKWGGGRGVIGASPGRHLFLAVSRGIK